MLRHGTVRRGIVLCIFSSAKIDHGVVVLEQGDDEALHSDPNEGETGELKKEMEETEPEEAQGAGRRGAYQTETNRESAVRQQTMKIQFV
ncbi:LOW QUALITY PROTEIN: hypothetical protein AGABI2DRAFT_190243, partial [Agaricus bisporus var. bisporus H97]|uniref:hypothetical protein n=1 Tax=Agaricus bisporus var. bisporus (strain H97 / ATCC MYA-4626 / FGSC 10389) TaxID=936046 RepID=UPI00029F6831